MIDFFRGKKVLVMGLGFLGGGIATTKWLVKHGARVTVTDPKSRRELAPSIRALGQAAKKVRFVLGRHRAEDFKNSEIVVVNPAVPRESRFLKIAKKSGAILENEASLFFRLCKNPIIAVTGTRGKTTTVNWIRHFLKQKHSKSVLTGNSSDNPMLKALDKLDGKNPVVVELSSWHLELLPQSKRSPHIAVITNIYRDHMNRYTNMKQYALAKANIFRYQTGEDFVVLNKKNSWTKFFLKLRPRSKIEFFSDSAPLKPLRNRLVAGVGAHNFENLNAAALATRHFGISKIMIDRALRSLPRLPFRQEIIYQKKKIFVVNDATATSPDGAIAALKRFGPKTRLILIAGGTDKKLDYKKWSKAVKKYVRPENLFLLNGSATQKMVRELKKIEYFKETNPQIFEDLKILLKLACKQLVTNYKLPITILFSPGAASFEKFKNEFDRGRKFNAYWKKFSS